MGFNKRKRALLVHHMGEARMAALERGLGEKEEDLKAGNIDFKEVLNKCVDCGPPMVEVAPAMLAGATSFAEADEHDKAQGIERHVRDQGALFHHIVDNIFGADDLSAGEKLAKVKAAAGDLERRLGKSQKQTARPGSKAGQPHSVKGMNVLGRREERPTLPDTPGGRELAALGLTFVDDGEKDADGPAAASRALEAVLGRISDLQPWDNETLEGAIRPLAEELALKTGDLFGLIRVAVTGRTAAPPLFETMAVLGRQRTLERLRSALRRLGAEATSGSA